VRLHNIIVSGEIRLHEHKKLLWLSPHELSSLERVAADFPIISAYVDSQNNIYRKGPRDGRP
jgi:hypothetical protein